MSIQTNRKETESGENRRLLTEPPLSSQLLPYQVSRTVNTNLRLMAEDYLMSYSQVLAYCLWYITEGQWWGRVTTVSINSCVYCQELEGRLNIQDLWKNREINKQKKKTRIPGCSFLNTRKLSWKTQSKLKWEWELTLLFSMMSFPAGWGLGFCCSSQAWTSQLVCAGSQKNSTMYLRTPHLSNMHFPTAPKLLCMWSDSGLQTGRNFASHFMSQLVYLQNFNIVPQNLRIHCSWIVKYYCVL